MKKTAFKTLFFAVLTAFLLSAAVLAQEPNRPPVPDPQPQQQGRLSEDFRVNLMTNRTVYHNGDVLHLTVQLLNHDDRPVLIAPRRTSGEATNDIADIAAGNMDGMDVDVAIVPDRQRIIGHIIFTRLGPSPVAPGVVEETVPQPQPQPFRLPLFGPPFVPGHSTQIISLANLLIDCPPPPDPDAPEPEFSGEEPGEPGPPVDLIPAIGRCADLTAGYYLMTCRITEISGTRFATAQKTVRIMPRPPMPAEPPAPPTPDGPLE